MDERRLELVVGKSEAGSRLDAGLRRLIEREAGLLLTHAGARALLAEGRVQVGGQKTDRASRRLERGERLVVMLPESEARRARTPRGPSPAAPAPAVRIVYEDEQLLAIDKPPRLPSHATKDPRRDHALRAAKRLLEERGEAGTHLFACHRLDADTSGVLLLAKTKDAAARIGSLLGERAVEKVYDALVWARDATLEETWTVESYLATRAGKTRSVRSGGDPSRTDFRLISRVGPVAHVEARPRTGRTHQVRVHLAEGGTPILGDRLYGHDEAFGAAPRLMLHARELVLPPSGDGGPARTLRAPLPSDFGSTLAGEPSVRDPAAGDGDDYEPSVD